MAKQKYPNLLFVKEEADRDGSKYFIVEKRIENLAEINETVQVAVYKLERIVRVVNSTKAV